MVIDSSNDQRLRKQAAIISLVVGLGMLVLKTSAYFITHSAAVLSDALESIVHLAATSMALYSVILSGRPADDSHPYGHGKVEFFSAGIEGGLIITAAAAIIYEAVRGIIMGRTLAELDTGFLLILGASVVNLLLGWFLVHRGKQTKSLTLVADGKHVLTDSWTSFGVVAGLGLVRVTGFELLDPIVAVVVAVNILVSGARLIRVSVGGLMDESDRPSLERIAAAIRKHKGPAWINLHQLRSIRSGALQNIDFHLIIPFYWTVAQAHQLEHEIRDAMGREMDDNARVLIHLDPCSEQYCAYCTVEPCGERKSPRSRTLAWSVAEMTGPPPKRPDF